MKTWFKNKIIAGLLIGVVITLISALFVQFNPFYKLHFRFSNQFYNYNQPSNEIVIVALDDKTFSRSLEIKGLGKYSNWSRQVYTSLVEKLDKGNPKAIVFDILFNLSETGISKESLTEILENDDGQSAEGVIAKIQRYAGGEGVKEGLYHPIDQEFADMINNTKKVILAFVGKAVGVYEESKILALEDTQYSYLFDPNLTSSGLASVFPDPDDTIRRTPLSAYNLNTQSFHENLALRTLRTYFGASHEIDANYTPDLYTFRANGQEINIPLGDGQMLINFLAPPFEQNHVSFIDVYTGKVPPETFKDKIVLIGVTSPQIPDYHYVPNSNGVAMPGVEIHANIIQTILDQKFLQNQTFFSQLKTVAVIAIGTTILLNYLNIWLGILLVLLIGALYTYAAQWFYYQGLLLHMVNPYITLALTYLASLIYRYFSELKEKLVVKGAFSHYVNKNVVQQILKTPEMLKLGGQKREVTVFFSDIANFTSISEKLAPEDLVALINEYLDAMTKVILKHGGTLDKYEGDAIMAFFNAPLDQPDHALRAVTTALECRQALHQLHQQWQKEAAAGLPEKPLFDFRIGLATGPAIVGNMGSSDRFDYTAMGVTINLGSRLESGNKFYGTHLMINATCAAHVQEHFELRDLDLIRVKGKETPEQVYEVLASKGQLTPEQQQLLTHYHNGLNAYRQGEFQQALDNFKLADQALPQDPATTTFITRCEQLLQNPPASWDGVWTFEGK